MSKAQKLIERIKDRPKDFTWDELVKLLSYYGYAAQKSGKTGGSRRKFYNKEKHIISLHKPHPGNIVKAYVIEQIIQTLKEKGHI
jgi:hypothetical protein